VLRLLAAHPASLRFLRSAVPPLRTETTRPPRFLENPPVHALLSDPGGTAVSGHSGPALLLDAAMLPSAFSTTSAPTTRNFEAQSHGLHTCCLRFAATVTRVLPTAAQDSLPAGGPPWPGGIRTRWVPAKGFSFRSSHQHSPFPGLAWRTENADLNVLLWNGVSRQISPDRLLPSST
jgi:hypothetical protein